MKTVISIFVFAAGLLNFSAAQSAPVPSASSQEEQAAQAMRASLLKAQSGASGEADSGSRSPASRTKNAIVTKRYPGGGDEDDLQVQPVLQVPTRTYDGSLLGDEAPAE